MNDAPIVHVIAVGDELRSGKRQDTNGPWMARQLGAVGIVPKRLHVAGDDPDDLSALLRRLSREATLIVLCGGLGPTGDDTTRQALAQALGVSLQARDDAWQQVEATLRARGREPNALQRSQALLPEGSDPLRNPVGTAPGIRARLDDATIVSLPGVPVELRAMFERHVLPLARALGQPIPARATIWTAGVPESDLAHQVEALSGARDVSLAYYAHHGEIELVVQGVDASRVGAFAEAARRLLGVAVFDPPPGGRIEHAVVAALARERATVAVAESVTGGQIAGMLTSVPGASDVLAFGWVTYANAAKTDQLGVPADLIAQEGVVSAAVARAMAQGARERAGATFGLATTGVAGPGDFEDGRRQVPAGRVHVALASADGSHAVQMDGPRPRALVRRLACVRALDLLRRALAGSA